ncbi:ImmA/IrrE family metallo-endopeptidase [Leptospira kmetyi]|uniref:ImmA/IrrE family metallo-endopeptidase n=1 Tax=Leptospira kmetyi TaxID=408139 RepID=A0AAD0USB7_9LEPT|nr:XRE family transcriptional regulator [Leptospira kmetyi]AYV57708.1 ImmA/IrrE family metallo-endopeptidase [Leptospira kmetyi]
MDKFNPQLLQIARESRLLTQKELANEINITQGYLSKIESGVQLPDSILIDNFSKTLKYPKEFFFVQTRKKDAHLDFYRKQRTISTKQIDYLKAHINLYRIQLENLLSSINFNVDKIPEYEVDITNGPEIIAKSLRKFWNIASGPIQNLSELLEEHGFVIIHTFIEDTIKFSGCSFFTRSHHPIIIINGTMPGDRIRFTIAHELGHLLMHKDDIYTQNRDIEKEANIFASELLMPSREIKEQLIGIDLNKLIRIKHYWKTSIASLLEKAKSLNTITIDQYKYLRIKLNREGFAKKEPVEIPIEEIGLISEILELYKSELGYSDKEISNLLYLYPEEYISKYKYHQRKRIRLIK